MKSKASLTLMEQLVMVLVFALAAAVCLRAFVYADKLSRETQDRDRAVYIAQNGAETVKACRGGFAEAAALLGGAETEEGLTVCYETGFRLEAERLPTETAGLGRAEIRVTKGDEVLFSLTVAWQEVDG